MNMKKYIVLSVLALVLVSGTALAKSENGVPFADVWSAITNLQNQITNIQLLPGPQGEQGLQGIQGEQGEKGDKGDSGDSATHGAGNIAFLTSVTNGTYVLKTDGTVWQQGGGIWKKLVGNQNILPVPVSDIVAWEYYSFIDKNGDYWDITGSGWVNLGQP